MPDRLQYQFADDVYNLQRSVNVDSSSSLGAGTAPYDPEPMARKRGKFTRSKTGCLTCRTKKVKCDEEKPDCKRCRDTQRKCTWPEVVPAARKRPPRRDTRQSESPLEVRPSTAGSSGLSDISTPPPRPSSPPQPHLLPSHIHPSAVAHQPVLPRPMNQRHMSTPGISNSQRQQMMMDHNSLSYALQTQGHGHPSAALNMPALPQQRHAAAPASHPYRYPAQSQYVQQQSYPNLQGLSRVTTQPHDYASVKLEDTYEPPMKFEEAADEWQASQLPHSQQHIDPIQPFFPLIQDRDYTSQYATQHYRY